MSSPDIFVNKSEVDKPILLRVIIEQLRKPENERWRAAMKKAYKPSCGCKPDKARVIVYRKRERRADGCCSHRTCLHYDHDFDIRDRGELEIREALHLLTGDVEARLRQWALQNDCRFPRLAAREAMTRTGLEAPLHKIDYCMLVLALKEPPMAPIITRFFEALLAEKR